MPDKTDILKDPTAHLHRLLTERMGPTEERLGWMELHVHIRDGGPLPSQWLGERTAVGRMVADAELNASALRRFGYKASANMTLELVRAVTGEG